MLGMCKFSVIRENHIEDGVLKPNKGDKKKINKVNVVQLI